MYAFNGLVIECVDFNGLSVECVHSTVKAIEYVYKLNKRKQEIDTA